MIYFMHIYMRVCYICEHVVFLLIGQSSASWLIARMLPLTLVTQFREKPVIHLRFLHAKQTQGKIFRTS
jgi:hypothetical protein